MVRLHIDTSQPLFPKPHRAILFTYVSFEPRAKPGKRVLAEAARDATRVYAKKSIKKLPKKKTLTKKQRRALKADKADPLLALHKVRRPPTLERVS